VPKFAKVAENQNNMLKLPSIQTWLCVRSNTQHSLT